MTDPATAAERLVARVWSELLELPEPAPAIGRDDDFFQLGGSSLMLVQLAARLSAASGVDIELLDLFTATTVRAQAVLVNRDGLAARARALPPITPLARPGEER
ncbi:phosphopantetheine-binding protein [Micromonospora sp. NPDC048999]|uniref:phosphopantetheine-binding protein n=1 Tax=Micromonospora sp. NPDC048999 TaxID=3155391 RepID=UPI003400EF84